MRIVLTLQQVAQVLVQLIVVLVEQMRGLRRRRAQELLRVLNAFASSERGVLHALVQIAVGGERDHHTEAARE